LEASEEVMALSQKQDVYETMRDRIIYVQYEPGMLIDEKEICRELGISRTPLREALLRLKEQGLVTVYPRFGSYVSEINVLDLRDLFIVKKNLDGLASELAATRMPDSALEHLTRLVDEIEPSRDNGDFKRLVAIDQQFHEAIHDSTFNKPLNDLLEVIRYRCRRGWFYFMDRIPGLQGAAVHNLAEVLAAFEKKDSAEARRAMEIHVSCFIDAFSKLLER
jgi:DNA-binding GntR family transcriptional regulator